MYGNIGFYLIFIFLVDQTLWTPPPPADEGGGEKKNISSGGEKKKRKEMYEFYVLSHGLCFYFRRYFTFL